MKSLALFKNKRLALGKFLNGPLPKDDLARAYARCFNSRDGQMVLEHLHQITVFRITDPLIDPAALRQLEGQRQLVLFVCQQMAKGQKN
ncbi:MAG TPA: hypothetical protein VGF14_02580 [Alphaproteobacteria bacterium]